MQDMFDFRAEEEIVSGLDRALQLRPEVCARLDKIDDELTFMTVMCYAFDDWASHHGEKASPELRQIVADMVQQVNEELGPMES